MLDQVLVRTTAPGMALVPGGKFKMGCATGWACAVDQPQHDVALEPFFIDAFEVSVTSYAACVNAGGCSIPQTTGDDRTGGQRFQLGQDREPETHPVNGVDWFPSRSSYCKWAKRRLPTEAEWEKLRRS